MKRDRIRSVAIAGGGMAGWNAAAAIADALRGQDVTVTVLEDPVEPASETAVAEATLPVTHAFLQRLGISEQELMRASAATFTLGCEFRDWTMPGHVYFQPLNPHGSSIEFVHFHHFAARAHQEGDETPFNDYSLCAVAARRGKFAHPVNDPGSILSTLMYAHHLDTGLYADFMARHAMALGARRETGAFRGIEREGDSGLVRALRLDDGRTLEADLFIDCSGRGARLMSELGVACRDWSEWLPADRMLVHTVPAKDPPPHSTTIGLGDSWLRSVPSRRKTTHRLVYSSRRLDDEAARNRLSETTAIETGDAARTFAFNSGCLEKFWSGNCLAVGDAAGFMEPLADTRTALMQTGLMRLVSMFPDRSFDPMLADEYNRTTTLEYENIRDYLALHYRAGELRDAPFWRDCRSSEAPPTLAHKIRLFDELGQVALYEEESFPDTAWVSVWLGQGHWPGGYDPTLDNYEFARLQARFEQMKDIIARAAAGMPTHGEYLARYCG